MNTRRPVFDIILLLLICLIAAFIERFGLATLLLAIGGILVVQGVLKK